MMLFLVRLSESELLLDDPSGGALFLGELPVRGLCSGLSSGVVFFLIWLYGVEMFFMMSSRMLFLTGAQSDGLTFVPEPSGMLLFLNGVLGFEPLLGESAVMCRFSTGPSETRQCSDRSFGEESLLGPFTMDLFFD